jgi:hypothetical protein
MAGDQPSQRHCAASHCVPVADLFLRAQADADLDGGGFGATLPRDGIVDARECLSREDKISDRGRDGGGAGGDKAKAIFSKLTDVQREVAVASLPRSAKEAAATLTKEAALCRSPATIMHALEALADALGVRLRGADKKAERSLLHAHKKGMEARLSAEEQPAAALLLAVPLVLAVTRGRAVAMTGRSLAPALALIGEGGLLPTDDLLFMVTFHRDVVASLAHTSGAAAKTTA